MSSSALTGMGFLTVEVIGTMAFAISGVMAAARARMDWLGAAVLALVVAVGGGTLRDLLLGQLPVSWLVRIWPVFVALGTAAVMLVILRVWPNAQLDSSTPLLIADAAGLSAFVIIGTDVGLRADLNPILAVMLGVLTGVGGGVIRDLMTGNRPTVLVGQVYAVAGIAGATWFVLLTWLQWNEQLVLWSSVAMVLGLRLIAIRRNWNLPKVMPEPQP